MTLPICFLQRVDDELFPMKDGEILTADIDYVDVWKVRALTRKHTSL